MKIKFIVFCVGGGQSKDRYSEYASLIGNFSNATSWPCRKVNNWSEVNKVISEKSEKNKTERTIKMCFDGPLKGNIIKEILFAKKSRKQRDTVCDIIENLLFDYYYGGHEVEFYGVGHSLGAAVILSIVKKLANIKISQDSFSIRLFLHDPVSGELPEFVTTLNKLTYPKWLKKLGTAYTRTVNILDLSQHKFLHEVITVYPNLPVPLHVPFAPWYTPVIPKYPNNCKVNKVIIPGGHAGTAFSSHTQPAWLFCFIPINPKPKDCLGLYIAYQMLHDFLKHHNISFTYRSKDGFNYSHRKYITEKEHLLEVMNNYVEQKQKDFLLTRKLTGGLVEKSEVRKTHTYKGSLYLVSDWSGKYLNRYHEKLAIKYDEHPKTKSINNIKYMLYEKNIRGPATSSEQILNLFWKKKTVNPSLQHSPKGCLSRRNVL